MRLDRTARMVNALRGYVGRVRSFGRVERAEPAVLSIDAKLRNPFATIFTPMNAEKTGAIVLSRPAFVLRIHLLRYLSQIRNAVASLFAVPVVKVANRPTTVNVEPCEDMGGVVRAVNVDDDVAGSMQASGNVANVRPASVVSSPRKNAGLWIVIQQFAQSFSRQHFAPYQSLNFTS